MDFITSERDEKGFSRGTFLHCERKDTRESDEDESTFHYVASYAQFLQWFPVNMCICSPNHD